VLLVPPPPPVLSVLPQPAFRRVSAPLPWRAVLPPPPVLAEHVFWPVLPIVVGPSPVPLVCGVTLQWLLVLQPPHLSVYLRLVHLLYHHRCLRETLKKLIALNNCQRKCIYATYQLSVTLEFL
jgi:hypothetical protein